MAVPSGWYKKIVCLSESSPSFPSPLQTHTTTHNHTRPIDLQLQLQTPSLASSYIPSVYSYRSNQQLQCPAHTTSRFTRPRGRPRLVAPTPHPVRLQPLLLLRRLHRHALDRREHTACTVLATTWPRRPGYPTSLMSSSTTLPATSQTPRALVMAAPTRRSKWTTVFTQLPQVSHAMALYDMAGDFLFLSILDNGQTTWVSFWAFMYYLG
ncbi:hypothetical protein TOPH_04159 [Tolypocladium ophioglossoides CBS 100239]|uniref:Uncharacterized protein n=1 Tax=Tolypocladium ophioglossoides (strain CBS 100239) TaxID=1163406 RepID=A0A0L0NB13_TOLOC|nr:hypothetical protein TOPH_04159 [Tolypocladium ophioglossoides CBS 100239]